MTNRTTRHRTRLLSIVLLALVAAGCGDGVDGDRRQLAIDIGESIQTPAGYERSTEIVVRDPDLSAFAPQPGEIAQGWRPIDPDATPADTLKAFHPALEAAGYQLVLATECTDDVLSLVYWHPETGTANLGHGDTAQGVLVIFSDAWSNDAPTSERQEVDLPDCPE